MNAAVRTRSAADILVDNLSSEQFLTFEIGSELFAIPILAVQEIRGWEKVSHIPRTQAHVLGVINLRGTVVPVLDVRTRLGIESRAVTATTVVIVVRIETAAHEKTTVGCVVDAVSDVATIGADQIRPAPSACGSVDSHFIRGVASIDERLVLLLDIARLIEQSTTGDAIGHGPAEETQTPAAGDRTLFDRIGGSGAVDAAVNSFYDKVMADPLLKDFFAGTDMTRQKQMQRSFLTLAFGGPNQYTGRGLRAAHGKAVEQGLGDAHFDAVVGHLAKTLTELQVPQALIGEVAAVAESVRADVLCR